MFDQFIENWAFKHVITMLKNVFGANIIFYQGRRSQVVNHVKQKSNLCNKHLNFTGVDPKVQKQ